MPDEGWVRIYHPDQLEDPDKLPDPDHPEGADNTQFATVTLESYEGAWKNRGWRNLDEDRAGAATEDMPGTASGRIAWIDEVDDPEARKMRAQAVYDDENEREGGPRVTALEHAEDVLAETSDEDQTVSTTSEEEA